LPLQPRDAAAPAMFGDRVLGHGENLDVNSTQSLRYRSIAQQIYLATGDSVGKPVLPFPVKR